MQDPQTTEEWQEAVDVATFLQLHDSAKQYGLVTGGPQINHDRCDQILREGAQRGFKPADVDVLIERFLHVKPVAT